MRVALCILVVVALSVFAASNANESRVAWQRGDDPFMRMAKKVGSNAPVLLQMQGDKNADHGDDHHVVEEVHEEVHEEVLHDENGPTDAAKKDNPAQAKIDANKAKVQGKAAEGKASAGEKPEAAKSQQQPAAAQNKKEDKPTLPPSPAQSQQSNGKVAPKETAASKPVMKMLNEAGKGAASKDNIKDQANKKVQDALKAVASGGQANAAAGKAAPAGKPGAACQNVPVCKTQVADEGSKKQNYTMLVPVKKDGNKVDVKKLGGTPKMSVENKDFKQAGKVLEKVDDSHEAFVNKHEKDCKGKICPLEGDKDKKKKF